MTRTTHERRYDLLRRRVDRHLASLITPGSPRALRDACAYVLSGGGKRLRAILVLLGAEAVGGSAARALHAAAAVEIMHNFTLVHDDIMDHASTRRGRPTVHVRWDLNTALLAGDTLLAIAYKNLMRTRHKDPALLAQLFTASVIGVCEGQALDLEYEQRENVRVADYFTMIEQKTGRLVTVAAELGGCIGGGTPGQITALRQFGHHLGRAFQLQDDLLDVIGDEREFGKAIGGDIIEGKRTYLLVRARERARGADRTLLDRVMRRKTIRPTRPESIAQRRALVTRVRATYERYGIIDDTRREVMENTVRAVNALRVLPASPARTTLHWLAGASSTGHPETGMIERTVTIVNKAGLHTRPAAAIVKTASRFHSEFTIRKGMFEINGKSIIGVMTLAAEQGSTLDLVFTGADEEAAAQAVVELFEQGFGEN